jgi:hypothetical protein
MARGVDPRPSPGAVRIISPHPDAVRILALTLMRWDPSPHNAVDGPTGRSVTADYIQVLRFRDGKHASFSLVYDRLQMLEQLGLIPAPAG